MFFFCQFLWQINFILFLRTNDQQLKEEEMKKKLDLPEKQKDEEKKKQVEANLEALYESKKSLEDFDKEIEVKEKNARKALEVAQGLLKHGMESLVTAKRDVTALRVARVMIQSPHKKMAEVKQQLKNLHEQKNVSAKEKLSCGLVGRWSSRINLVMYCCNISSVLSC